MNKKVKYNYSYFLIPYIIDFKKYNEYILKLLNNDKVNIKSFDKIGDLELCTKFFNHYSKEIFYTDIFKTKKNGKLDNKLIKKYHKTLTEKPVAFFTYDFSSNTQGKLPLDDKNDSIFFNVDKLEIVCFKPGVCFVILKTNIDSSEFYDILDFNYRFKEIFSELDDFKKYQKIKLQSDEFNAKEDLELILKEIISPNFISNINKTEMDHFYTFAYLCLENTSWNENTENEALKMIIHKYMKVYSSSYDTDIDNLSFNLIDEYKYRKIGVTKISSNLICSGVDTYNFTFLPVEYESIYFYTYVFALYSKTFLTYINSKLKSAKTSKEISELRKYFLNFTRYYWDQEISLSEKISVYKNNTDEALELEEIYDKLQNKFQLLYNEKNIEKYNKRYGITIILLIILIITNLLYFKGFFNNYITK